jgi:hypothetical protein
LTKKNRRARVPRPLPPIIKPGCPKCAENKAAGLTHCLRCGADLKRWMP